MYQFDTHYGQSTLTDEETGIVLDWTNGQFNETQQIRQDGATLLTIIPDGEDPASWLARKMREMGDYIAENYPDLV